MSEHAAAFPLRSNGHPTTVDPASPAVLESARLAALGELVRGFAHEINNPLFGILGLVEFLLADAEPGTKAHERLTLVQDSGTEIKRITQALLNFARSETDVEVVVPLQEIAAGSVELVRCTSAGTTVEFMERYPDEPLLVEGAPGRLSQIFLSLIVNAQQAMPAEGTVTIEIERDAGWVVARVSDTGTGISPEVRPRMFEAFSTTKGNTGLGLAPSLEIARAHGGDLIALSTQGAGATFVLRLPAFGRAE